MIWLRIEPASCHSQCTMVALFATFIRRASAFVLIFATDCVPFACVGFCNKTTMSLGVILLVVGSASIIVGSALLWDAIRRTEFGPNGPIRSSFQYSSMAFVFSMLVAWFHWLSNSRLNGEFRFSERTHQLAH